MPLLLMIVWYGPFTIVSFYGADVGLLLKGVSSEI